MNQCTMTQDELNVLNKELTELIDKYRGGLITIIEFLDTIISLRLNRVPDKTSVAGLICPNTGLRYPTEAEIAIIDSTIDILQDGVA